MVANGTVTASESRVFVMFPISRNIESARDHGTITYIFERQVFANQKSQDQLEAIGASILEKLNQQGFDPSNDYVLLVGSTVLLILISTLVVEHYGAMRGLAYNKVKRNYTPVVFDAEKIEDEYLAEEDV